MSQTRPESPAMGGSYIRQTDGTLVPNAPREMREAAPEPAPKPTEKPTAKPTAKPAPKPTAKPAARPAVKED